MFDLAQKLFELSKKMLANAQRNEWEDIPNIQAERQKIIAQLEQSDMSRFTREESAAMEKLLTQSRAIEKQCVELTETAKKGLTNEQVKVSKGRAMQKAYGANSNQR